MQLNLKRASNEELKTRAIELLAQGIVPYTNWANVFANPKLADWPGLQAKAFHVWFPTMLDYLSGRDESNAIKKELDSRKVQYENVFELSERLELCFRSILSMYTVEEQILIRDRRLQNVHGKLQINQFETHVIKVFEDEVVKREFSAEEYRNLIMPFYRNLSHHSKEMIARLLNAEVFRELTELFENQLQIDKHLMPLIEKLGVSAAAGNG